MFGVIFYSIQANILIVLVGSYVVNAISAAQKAVSGSVVVGGLGDGECFTNDTEWAIWANLRSDPTTAWCIDSVGKADVVPVQDSSLVDRTVCP